MSIAVLSPESIALFGMVAARHSSTARLSNLAYQEFCTVVNTLLLHDKVLVLPPVAGVPVEQTQGGLSGLSSGSGVLRLPWVARLLDGGINYQVWGAKNIRVWRGGLDRDPGFPSGAYMSECAIMATDYRSQFNPFELCDGIDFIEEACCRYDSFYRHEYQDDFVVNCNDLGVDPEFINGLMSPVAGFGDLKHGGGDFADFVAPYTSSLLDGIQVYSSKNRDLRSAAYAKIEEVFGDEVAKLRSIRSHVVSLPPFVSVLLSRIPDNCSNPGLVVRELLELRMQLESFRRRMDELQSISTAEMSLKQLGIWQKAVFADAEAMKIHIDTQSSGGAIVKNSFDLLQDCVVSLAVSGVPEASISSVVKQFVPRLSSSICRPRRTAAFRVAKEAYNVRGQDSLLPRKLPH